MRAPKSEVVTEVLANARPAFVEHDDGHRTHTGRCLKRGSFERRIIAQKVIDGVEHAYHATKGWRRRWYGR